MSVFSWNVPSRRASASVIDACGKASLARPAQSASVFGPSAHAGESPVATPFKMTRAVPTDTLKRIASLRFCLGRLTLPFFAAETFIRQSPDAPRNRPVCGYTNILITGTLSGLSRRSPARRSPRKVGMDLNLRGKLALVTGASKGIGLACARQLAEEGCHLHLASRTKADLERAKETIQARHNVSVTIHPVDLSNGDAARSLASACSDIDILVNNAGAIPAGDLQAIDEARWRDAWNLKVFGYINLCRAVYPGMKARGGGVIVNVLGAAGERPTWGYIAGSAGNASLMAFTRGMGGTSLVDRIRIVACNPGLIRTERMETMLRASAQTKFGDPARWQELIPTNPPVGTPEQCADLVAFLASDRASHIAGTVVTIDGGAAHFSGVL